MYTVSATARRGSDLEIYVYDKGDATGHYQYYFEKGKIQGERQKKNSPIISLYGLFKFISIIDMYVALYQPERVEKDGGNGFCSCHQYNPFLFATREGMMPFE